jgi:hypothetical protein
VLLYANCKRISTNHLLLHPIVASTIDVLCLSNNRKDTDYSWIENMVRRATASDGDLDKALFEPIAKGCRD